MGCPKAKVKLQERTKTVCPDCGNDAFVIVTYETEDRWMPDPLKWIEWQCTKCGYVDMSILKF